jgi:hypothetical protein
MANTWLMDNIDSIGSQPVKSVKLSAPTKSTPAPISQPKPVVQDKKYMSGNLMDKAFDVIRTPEYAQTGFVQGGANKAKELGVFNKAPIQALGSIPSIVKAGIKAIPEAIKTRKEIGREAGQYNIAEDAGIKNKYAQTGVNFATSLAAPSLALGPVFKGAGKIAQKIPGVSKATGKIAEYAGKAVGIARKTPQIAKVVEKVDPYFRNPELGKMVKAAEERVANRQTQVFNAIQKSTEGLKPEEQRIIGQILEGKVVSDPTGKYNKLAQPIREMSDAIGKEAVDLGLLDAKSYEQFKGKYMTHVWDTMRKGGENVNFGNNIIPKGTSKFFTKQRKGAEGYISEFGPATTKGLGTEVRDIEVAKMYKEISDKFGTVAGDLQKGESFAPSGLASSRAGKSLRNKVFSQEVVDAMRKTLEPQKRSIFDKALDLWKKGKTLYNPAYHVRNLASNQILSDMSTGDGLIKTGINYGRAVKEYKKGGQFLDAAKKAGLIGRQNLSGAFEEAKKTAGISKKANIFQRVDKAVTGAQNVSEETAKLNVFTTWVKKAAKEAGKSVQEALSDEGIIKMAKDKAEEAIFSPYNISKTERGIASKVVPFYSFTRQATPFVAKTALNKPGTLSKYEKAKTAVEGLSEDRTGEYRPDSAKNQIRLPIKDKEGRSYYADPQYILPWGSLGEDAGGNLSKGRLPLGLSISPQFTIPAELAMNKQLYYDTPITKSSSPSKRKEDYKNYLLRSIGPAVLSSGQKLKQAIAGEPDWAGRSRNIPSAVGSFLGAKTASFIPEEQKKFDTGAINKKTKDIRNEIIKLRKSNDPNKDKYIKELQQEIIDLRK